MPHGHGELTKERHLVARDYLQKFDNCSKTSIARLLVEDNPLLFDDVEKTRNILRYLTNNHGSLSRKNLKDKSDIKQTNMKNIYGLLDNEHNDVSPYVLPKSAKRIGVISDVHIPYHDVKAVTLALDWLKEKQIDTLILNGDIIDFYQASTFTRDPGKRDLSYELEAARQFLKAVWQQFKNCNIIYLEGNHEYRWKRFLMLKAPEVFHMSEFQMDIILKLNDYGIQWVDNKRIIKAGKLNIMHGHEYYGSYSPVNPAKGIYNKAKNNVLFGHFHRTSQHISKDIEQNVSGAWSCGCLCDLQPEYAPYNEWNHGFALVKVDQHGIFNVVNKTIINGEIE